MANEKPNVANIPRLRYITLGQIIWWWYSNGMMLHWGKMSRAYDVFQQSKTLGLQSLQMLQTLTLGLGMRITVLVNGKRGWAVTDCLGNHKNNIQIKLYEHGNLLIDLVTRLRSKCLETIHTANLHYDWKTSVGSPCRVTRPHGLQCFTMWVCSSTCSIYNVYKQLKEDEKFTPKCSLYG